MKILIIDDQQAKAQELGKIVKHIYNEAELLFASNARDGFLLLEGNNIGLIFLDVVLPLTFDSDPSESGSVWFVEEIHRKLPRRGIPLVVGTTQFPESLARVQDTFRNYLWSIVLVSGGQDSWIQQVEIAIDFARSNVEGISFGGPGLEFDAAIITALRNPEFSELIEALGGGQRLDLSHTNETWLKSSIRSTGGKTKTIVAACADDMGMTAMASLVTKVCISCKPRVLILVGIMAGNKQRVGLSDLICVEATWDCRAGKLTEEGFLADVKSRSCDYKLLNKAIDCLTDDFFMNFWKDSKKRFERPDRVATLHKGDVACSPSVVADPGIFKELEQQRRKILGLEMEAYGCYDAVRRLGDLSPRVLCLKSVCDFGDGEKNDKYQPYCAALAAAALVRLIKDPQFDSE